MKLYLGAVQLSKVAKGTFPLLPAVLVKKATTPPPPSHSIFPGGDGPPDPSELSELLGRPFLSLVQFTEVRLSKIL